MNLSLPVPLMKSIWSLRTRWQHLCQLLLLLLCAANAGAQSCQNTNGLALETPPADPSMGVLELDDGPGVDCEIDLFPGGQDPDGGHTVIPPRGYQEAYVQHSPPDYNIAALGRELSIHGYTQLPELTLYRLTIETANDNAVVVESLNVLVRRTINEYRLELRLNDGVDPSGKTNSTLASIPYGVGSVPCTRTSGLACIRSYWEKLPNGSARLRVELATSATARAVVERTYGSAVQQAPRVALGYLAAIPSADLSGSMGLRHRICYYRRKDGSGGAMHSCNPTYAQTAAFDRAQVRPGEAALLSFKAAAAQPYPVGVQAVFDIDEEQFAGYGGKGWFCRFDEDFSNQLFCHGDGAAHAPALVLKLRAPLYPGRIHVPIALHWAGTVIAESSVHLDVVPAP